MVLVGKKKSEVCISPGQGAEASARARLGREHMLATTCCREDTQGSDREAGASEDFSVPKTVSTQTKPSATRSRS